MTTNSTIPAGMKAYGPEHPDYPNAPKDWDAEGVLLGDGMIACGAVHWAYGDPPVVAYTPRTLSAHRTTPEDGESKKLTMTISLTQREQDALERLMAEQELSGPQVFKCALREYQMGHERRKAGETVQWSGDAQRIREFAGSAISALPAERVGEPWTSLPEPITADDVPHWVKSPTDFYVTRRNEEIAQMAHEVGLGHRTGGTLVDWIDLAAGYIMTVGERSPEQGSLHHTLIIIAEQLYKANRERAASAPPGDAGLLEALDDPKLRLNITSEVMAYTDLSGRDSNELAGQIIARLKAALNHNKGMDDHG